MFDISPIFNYFHNNDNYRIIGKMIIMLIIMIIIRPVGTKLIFGGGGREQSEEKFFRTTPFRSVQNCTDQMMKK